VKFVKDISIIDNNIMYNVMLVKSQFYSLMFTDPDNII
jgi:hypothetical protein